MVTIAEIPLNIQRFINRERLEEIKLRAQRVPAGDTYHDNNIVICNLLNEKENVLKQVLIAEVHYPGASDAFANYKKDIEDLIRHVEEADKENDLLLEKIRQLEDVKTTRD